MIRCREATRIFTVESNTRILHWTCKCLVCAWLDMHWLFIELGLFWFHREHPRDPAKFSFSGPRWLSCSSFWHWNRQGFNCVKERNKIIHLIGLMCGLMRIKEQSQSHMFKKTGLRLQIILPLNNVEHYWDDLCIQGKESTNMHFQKPSLGQGWSNFLNQSSYDVSP